MSALGQYKPARAKPSGFTLVEILVVIVLIAIASAASMTLLRPSSITLADDAQRLAQIFERLALDARLSGRATAWRCDGNNSFHFDTSTPGVVGDARWQTWQVIAKHSLAPEIRLAGIQVDGADYDCAERLVLPVFGLAPDFVLVFSDAHGGRWALLSDAFGRVVARPQESL